MAEENTSVTLRQQIQRVFASQDAHTAFDLAKEIEEMVLAMEPEQQSSINALERVKAQLSLVALRYYSQKTIEELFENHAAALVDLPESVDIQEAISSRLITENFVDDRNKFRDALIESLQRSNDRLGGGTVQLGSQEVQPTVGNWLKLFLSEMGEGGITNVKVARFFAQNASVGSLTAKEKLALRRLLELYQFLQLRSNDPEGYEDFQVMDTGDQGIYLLGSGSIQPLYDDNDLRYLEEQVKEGQINRIQLYDLQRRYPDRFKKYFDALKESSSKTVDLASLADRTNAFIGEQKKKYDPGMSKKFPKDAKLSLQLKKPMALEDPNVSIAQLKQLFAKQVGNEKTFAAFMRQKEIVDLIQQEYPQELGEKNKSVLQQSVLAPLGFQALLQIVLKKIYELDEEEALWHSFQIIQRFPLQLRDFKTIVTYDINKGKLVWRY